MRQVIVILLFGILVSSGCKTTQEEPLQTSTPSYVVPERLPEAPQEEVIAAPEPAPTPSPEKKAPHKMKAPDQKPDTGGAVSLTPGQF